MMSVQQQQPQQQQQQMISPQQNNAKVTPFHTASLYVGDLDPEITETSLFEIFNQVGPVASIRVCRDTVTRKSLGYSYVNFHNVADAERALDTMNFSLIKGNPCRIMWSQRDPSMRRSGVGNVFVKNLDESVDNKALYDTFSLFGNILSCKVATDENAESKGYGYVHYETAESANEAISRIDGMMIAGKQVHVGHFVRRNDRAGQAEWTNIYVKNIPLAWDEQKLRTEFGKFGTITSIKIQSESSENGIVSKGFGFINFEDHAAADEAVKVMNGIDVSEKKEGEESEESSEEPQKLFCCRAQKKNERQRELQQKFEAIKSERLNKYQGINVFVKNLDDSVTDEKLNKMFSEYGTITSARIMKDPVTNESKGFGFVCFTSPIEASKAVQDMSNKLVGTKPIYVALAQRKEARRAQLEAQFARGVMGPRGTPMGSMQGGIYGMAMPYMMAGQPMPQSQPTAQQMSQVANRQVPTGYPMMPQMMQARGTPRGQAMPTYQNRGGGGGGAYPIPTYAIGGMQNPQTRRIGSAGVNPPPGQRAGNSMNNHPMQVKQQMGMIPQSIGSSMTMNPGGMIGRNQGGGGMSMSQRGPPAGMSSQPQRQGSNIKYSQQIRNSSMQQGGVPLGSMMGGSGSGGGMMMGSSQGPENLTAQALAAASPELQKNMIGERLYPLIHEIKPDLAGKITGMLLEMDNSELLHLLESPESLKAKIQEAMFVLEAHATD